MTELMLLLSTLVDSRSADVANQYHEPIRVSDRVYVGAVANALIDRVLAT